MAKVIPESVVLTPEAASLLKDIARDGSAKTKARAKAASELEARGLIHLKKGSATLTKAGRWATKERADG
jgi:Mn-dependent DtxR family transcriptional regulator